MPHAVSRSARAQRPHHETIRSTTAAARAIPVIRMWPWWNQRYCRYIGVQF